MSEEVSLRINNWDKFQAEHRRNTYLWFKFYLTYFRHGKHRELGDDGTILFLYLLCECADRRSAQIKLNPVIAIAQLNWTRRKFDQTKSHLISIGCISYDRQIAYEASREASQDRIEENRIEGEYVVQDQNTQGSLSPPSASRPTQLGHSLPVLVKIWNQHRGCLSQVRGCSNQRRRMASSRWKEKPDEEYWVSVVTKIAASRFCNGANDRGWRADFDFLIKPGTHDKVSEGKYDVTIPLKKYL